MFTTPSPVTAPMQLRIDTSNTNPGTIRVAVAGEIDLSNSDVLRGGLLGILSAQRPHRIEVDLARVMFMDCRGLTALILVREAAARSGCRLRITNLQPVVRRVLDLTGLHDVLTANLDQTPLAATSPDRTVSAGLLVAA